MTVRVIAAMPRHTPTRGSLSPDVAEAVRRGVEVLRAGGLVVYPTDTLYGLGCDPWDGEAVRRLFRAKGRPLSQPVPLLLGEVRDLKRVAQSIPEAVLKLVNRFWPSALTLVVPKAPGLLPEVTAGGDTLAVRLPDHPIPRGLAVGIGGAIVGTSANRSGGSDPTTAQQAQAQLGEAVDLVIDGGSCQAGQGSTVLDVSGPVWKILREGPITVDDLTRAGFARYLGHR